MIFLNKRSKGLTIKNNNSQHSLIIFFKGADMFGHDCISIRCLLVTNRGDSRVNGYPGLSPKIQDLLLLHINDWPVYMKFIIMCICQSEVRASVGGS